MTVVRSGDTCQRVSDTGLGAGLDARGDSVQGYQTFLTECRVDVPAVSALHAAADL